MQRSAMMVFVLPTMQTELGLTAAQVSQMQALKQQFITQAQQSAQQLPAKRQELDRLLASPAPNDNDVRTALSQVAQMEADRKFAAYQAGQRIRALLTPEQRAKLDAFTPEQLHDYIANHMTIAEHQQMMQILRGGMGPGMGRGMMRGMHGGMGPGGPNR